MICLTILDLELHSRNKGNHNCLLTVLLKLNPASESPGRLHKLDCWVQPQSFQFTRSYAELHNCIINKFPSNTGAACVETTVLESFAQVKSFSPQEDFRLAASSGSRVAWIPFNLHFWKFAETFSIIDSLASLLVVCGEPDGPASQWL